MLTVSTSWKGLPPSTDSLPDEKVWGMVQTMCQGNGYSDPVGNFDELSLYRLWVREENENREDVWTFTVVPCENNEEYTREVSLVVALLYQNQEWGGTIYHTFDKVYEIARAFLVKFPLDTVWGIGHETGDHEEALYEFSQEFISK